MKYESIHFFLFFFNLTYNFLFSIFFREQIKKIKNKSLKNSRNWIMEKKERRRKQGKKVREDSKYTGRKRCGKL